MIGRFITPPSFPGVVRPRAAHRSKHVPTENPRPYVLHAPLRPLIIDTGRAAFLAVHLLPRVCGEEPLEQLLTTNAKRIIETLVRPSGVTIKRYSKRADTDFRHASNLNVGDADGQTRTCPVPCSERMVGSPEAIKTLRDLSARFLHFSSGPMVRYPAWKYSSGLPLRITTSSTSAIKMV